MGRIGLACRTHRAARGVDCARSCPRGASCWSRRNDKPSCPFMTKGPRMDHSIILGADPSGRLDTDHRPSDSFAGPSAFIRSTAHSDSAAGQLVDGDTGNSGCSHRRVSRDTPVASSIWSGATS
jgi:hypothetical protein